MTTRLDTRTFLAADQDLFAALSNDRNPMHVDPVAARRTQAGAPVVHGVHATLWAMEHFVRAHPGRRATDIGVRFERFLYVGETIEAVVTVDAPDKVVIELRTDGSRAAVATLGFAGTLQPDGRASFDPTADARPVAEPIARDIGDLAGLADAFRPTGTDQALTDSFPALSALYGTVPIRSFAALSTLVGMECPGLLSIFSKLLIAFDPAIGTADTAFRYAVRRVQPLLRSAVIDVRAPGIHGHVETFVRQPPITQPDTISLRQAISPMLAASDKVLIVGGSRGLGELTAKLVANAGADVTITYARGVDEARAIANDITVSGGRCRILPFDINAPLPEQVATLGGPFTHLYYFATPPIFRKRGKIYDRAVLDTFLTFYVDAFSHVAQAVIAGCPAARIFFPSTSAVDEQPKGSLEYVISKLAGETLCAELTRTFPNIHLLVERLPRILTDQTATVLPVRSAEPLDLLLPIITGMHHRTVQSDPA